MCIRDRGYSKNVLEHYLHIQAELKTLMREEASEDLEFLLQSQSFTLWCKNNHIAPEQRREEEVLLHYLHNESRHAKSLISREEAENFRQLVRKAYGKGVYQSCLLYTSTLFVAFQMMFAIITPALITGSVAGRMKFKALFAFIALWLIVVYYPMAHMVWGKGGFLGEVLGSVDFAGGNVVHISSGVSGLVLSLLLVSYTHLCGLQAISLQFL